MQNLDEIKVLIPRNKEFCCYEPAIKELYESSQEKICDTNSYEFVRDNTLFYVFLRQKTLIGIIYFFKEGNRLFLNGCSNRKMYPINVYCLKLSTSWFLCDIYAEAQNRASALCLLKSGFKKIDYNLYIFKNKLEINQNCN